MSSKTTTQKPQTPTPEEKALQDLNINEKTQTGFAIATLVITILFAVFFSLGASVLSYRKFGSIGWAVLDFFFAYFYYPYYAFFLDTSAPAPAPAPAPTTAETMMGGMKKLLKVSRSRKH